MVRTQPPAGGRAVVSIALALTAALALAIVTAVLLGETVSWKIGPLHVRAAGAVRPLVIAALCAALLWIVGRPRRLGRPIAFSCLLATLFFCLALIARAAQDVPASGDGAVIESYTIDALHGSLLVGPYSQYHWNHPGPLFFYLMAPFYALSGWHTVGLDAAALAINILSILTIAWVTVRFASPTFAVVSTGLTVLFAVRFGGLLTSAWNPHVTIFPMMALMFVCAAIAIGHAKLLPLAALLATFVSQTHIGFAPTALALSGAALIAAFLIAREPTDRIRLRRTVGVTAWLIVALWFLPFAEQVTHHPGNLTKLWQFFTASQLRPAFGSAFMAWAAAVTGWMRPGFPIAVGGFADLRPPLWACVGAIGQVVAVGLVGAISIRRRRYFPGAFGLLLVLASFLTLWSVKNIVGGIADYAVFWMACLGPLSAALLVSVAVTASVGAWTDATWASRLIVPALVVLAIVYGVVQEQRAVNGSFNPNDQQVAAETIASAILAQMHPDPADRLLVAIDGPAWGVAAGAITRLQKAAVPFAVAESAVWMFGEALAPTGAENQEVVISSEAVHLTLVHQPGVRTIADTRGWFADVVPLAAAGVMR